MTKKEARQMMIDLGWNYEECDLCGMWRWCKRNDINHYCLCVPCMKKETIRFNQFNKRLGINM